MQNSVIRFTVSPRTTPCVSVGENIIKNQSIARGAHTRLEILNFSSLLQCKPADAISHVEFTIGGIFQKGEILARKKSILNEYVVKAEDMIEIVAIDEGKGLVTTRRFTGHDIIIKSPVKGTIKDVSDQYIDIAFDGLYFPATKAQGNVYAPILALRDDGFHTLDDTVGGKVVVVKAQAGIMSKLMALGASAVVTTETEIDNTVPHAILDPQTIDILSAYSGQHVLLDGEHRCLLL